MDSLYLIPASVKLALTTGCFWRVTATALANKAVIVTPLGLILRYRASKASVVIL